MKETKNNWLIYSSAGFQIIASLLFFGFIGNYIDKMFLTKPIFLITGLIMGAFFSLYEIWKKI